MGVDPSKVTGDWMAWDTRSWTRRDAMLYALGVGANASGDGSVELEFTTENSDGVHQRVLPTFLMSLLNLDEFQRAFESVGTFELGNTVDGRRRLELHSEAPAEGSMRYRSRVVGLFDKQTGALLVIETEARDTEGDRRLFTLWSEFFIRGAGGHGGARGPSGPRHTPPDRIADAEVVYATRPDQSLIYRLTGDRGRLHSDPAFARQFGFDRLILHGLCTYGFTMRALLHTVCGGDPARMSSIEGRFTSVVHPGDELTVSIWVNGDRAVFTTRTQNGLVVIDQGSCTFIP